MAPAYPQPDSEPAERRDASTQSDLTEGQPAGKAEWSLSRRGALAPVVALSGLSLVNGSAQAGHVGPYWNKDADAEKNELIDRGALAMQAKPTDTGARESTPQDPPYLERTTRR